MINSSAHFIIVSQKGPHEGKAVLLGPFAAESPCPHPKALFSKNAELMLFKERYFISGKWNHELLDRRNRNSTIMENHIFYTQKVIA
jgi:hypothetical protein